MSGQSTKTPVTKPQKKLRLNGPKTYYTGNKEEYILFSTDPNESIKREVRLDFMIEGQIYDFITVVQKGFREPFTNDFKLVSGGTFNVIK